MSLQKGFVTPFNDETLTSWLYRVSHQRILHGFRRETILPKLEFSWGGPVVQSIDFDFDFASDFFQLVVERLGLDPSKLQVFFSPARHKRIVDWPRRTLFCKSCIVSDIASGQLPGWRKSWCYRDAILCSVHHVTLCQLEYPSAASKSWDAFVQGVYGKSPKMTNEIERLIRLLYILSNRILDRKRQCSISDVNLFDNLYDVFLMARTLRHRAGVAHFVFGDKPVAQVGRIATYVDSILYGAETSDSWARCGSLLLTAYVMGLIRDYEIELIEAASRSANLNFPNGKSIISVIYFGCGRSSDYEFLYDHLGGFKRPPGSRVDNLFGRLEKHGVRHFFRDFTFGQASLF